MAYVARYTSNPEVDIERGWSGYFGYGDWATIDEAYDGIIEVGGDPDRADIRFDEYEGLYRLVHHDGLSCWELEAETIEDAIEEARRLDNAGSIVWGGFGYQTHGDVRVIAQVHDDLYIFECDYTTQEV